MCCAQGKGLPKCAALKGRVYPSVLRSWEGSTQVCCAQGKGLPECAALKGSVYLSVLRSREVFT